VSALAIGPEYLVFQHLLDLDKRKLWKDLVEASEDPISKTPDWLTPYLFSGVGNANLGNRDEAIRRLKHVKDEALGDPQYADAARILDQLGAH